MADDVVSVKIDASRLNLQLDTLTPEARDRLIATVFVESGILAARISARAQKVLQVRTGKFLRHIRPFVRTKGKNSVYGGVGIKDMTANLFEWGGTTGPHEIEAKDAKALLLQIAGGQVFARRVHHPGGKYAPRMIAHTPFEEMTPEIREALENAVSGAVDHVNALA